MDEGDGSMRWVCWACGIFFDPFERDEDGVDCPECGSDDVGDPEDD